MDSTVISLVPLYFSTQVSVGTTMNKDG